MKKSALLFVLYFLLSSAAFAAKMKVEAIQNAPVFLGEKEIVCTIIFSANSTELSQEARQILTQNISEIEQLDLDGKMLRLEGFASPEGDREKNFRLSIGRARAVERFLRVNHGVSFDNYITGFGPNVQDDLPAAGKRTVQIVAYDNPWREAEAPVDFAGDQE